jgi:DegV family protein with EDD domain
MPANNIRIVTDSASTIPPELASELDIEIVPINLTVGQETMDDGDLAPGELYRRMESGIIARTSQPAPGRFAEAYQRLRGIASSVISIHITSQHSGTCQSAALGASMLPDMDINIVDSRGISMGTGYLVLRAARMAKEGVRKEDILSFLEEMKGHIYTFATVSTVRYLQAGGRLGWVTGALATALDIKPILGVRDGTLGLIGKVRTRARSLDTLIQNTMKSLLGARETELSVIHAGALEEAKAVEARLEEIIGQRVSFLMEAPTVLAVHGGPGLLGIVSYGP